jgi:hypothetical protein
MTNIAKITRLKSVFLNILQITKSKIAPATDENPITNPIILVDSPWSSINKGVMYDIILSKIVQKNIDSENKNTGEV